MQANIPEPWLGVNLKGTFHLYGSAESAWENPSHSQNIPFLTLQNTLL